MKRGSRFTLVALLLLILLPFILLFGRYPTLGFISWERLLSDTVSQKIVLYIRLPRVILSLFLGAGLAMAGNTFQLIFRNPLVEPGFLGVTQGAAFGAAAAILFFPHNPLWLYLLPVATASVALVFSFFLAKKVHFGGDVIRLVVAGITVSALFTAGLGLLKYMADPLGELEEIVFWLLGGLHRTTWKRLLFVLPLLLPSLVGLYLFRQRVNLLSLDDRVSFSLGIRPEQERVLWLSLATLSVALLTAVSGIISWVGLIVPLLARSRGRVQSSMGYSAIFGALFMLLCDTLARSVVAFELPLGIVTAFFGAITFILILTVGKMGVVR